MPTRSCPFTKPATPRPPHAPDNRHPFGPPGSRLTTTLGCGTPLPPATVKRLLVSLLAAGTLAFTKHAYEETAKDHLTEIDVRNTLKGGVARPGEQALQLPEGTRG